MRRGILLLAVFGAAGMSANVDAAEPIQIGVSKPPKAEAEVPGVNRGAKTGLPGAPTAADYASKYSKKPLAPAPKAIKEQEVKNFYGDLFGDTNLSAPAGKSPTSAPDSKTPPAMPDDAAEPELGKPTKTPLTASSTKPESAEGVVPAGFERSEGVTDKSYIQQVGSKTVSLPGKTKGMGVVVSKPAPGTLDVLPQVPSVSIEWVRRSDINVGQECTLELLVKNTGNIPAGSLAVDAAFPATVRLTSAEPKPTAVAEQLTWTIDGLAAGAEHRILIQLIPSRRGDLATSANVRLTGTAEATFRVEEPLLKVLVKGPTDVMVGDSAAQVVTISNPGSGVAHDVRLIAEVPEGLEYAKGKQLLMEIGSLNPGDSQTVRVPLSAVKGGAHAVNFVATSSAEVTSSAIAQVNVIAPTLKLDMDGPGLRYKGRNARYSMTVTNNGSVPTNNVRVMQTVADGFKFLSADKGGKFDASRKTVTWFVGRLEPNQSAVVSCELNAGKLGEFSHLAQAVSDAGAKIDSQVNTVVEGESALVLEIADVDDPVEVGNETAYEIRVRNDGSKAENDVTIICELPVGLDVISAKGPTESLSENRLVMFKTLASLAPGNQALYRVIVRGTQEGHLRFRAKVTSGSNPEPLLLEEQTKFYSDVRK